MARGHRSPVRAQTRAEPAFAGLIDGVLVRAPQPFVFAGAIDDTTAQSVWTWMKRDLAPDLVAALAGAPPAEQAESLDGLMGTLLTRARDAIAAASTSEDAERRMRVQLGGEDVVSRLPAVLTALRCRAVIGKARDFGRATNAMTDEAALAGALQSMPLQDQTVAGLLMHAAMGEVQQPARIMSALIRLVGSGSEAAIGRAGYAPLVEALLAHAQNQLGAMEGQGPFRDIDRACAALERFHRLSRAVTGYVEFAPLGRWTGVVSGLTRHASDRVALHLRDMVPTLSRALRGDSASDEHESGLEAFNAMYMLATARDCRDSLALNTLIDPLWQQVGQVIEHHSERQREALRTHEPTAVRLARYDRAVRLVELRFGAEHAEILRRAREAATRRL
ncbi:hypothetical protein SAMN02983003_3035 [Devosia enhydra]|uniref:Uncharacterized protein n=2 Tax=Devosia enhydra TaxID=665118 RepID=A0A1K2I0R4_9HYPH|nr:hypothetical protein SAMN02983003_3035 [Devosia enhydra]